MVRRGYPPEFRRKVLDLIEEGRSVAHDLDISEQSIYTWRRQGRINYQSKERRRPLLVRPGTSPLSMRGVRAARRAAP